MATYLFLGVTCFSVNGGMSICSPTLTFKCLTHSPKQDLLQSLHIAESSLLPAVSWWYLCFTHPWLTSLEHLEAFRNFLKGWYANISFPNENEKWNRISFVDVQIMYKYKRSDYLPLLPTITLPLVEFICILTAFYHLTIYTLTYRCFRICSSWTKLQTELLFPKQIFLKNCCPQNFINRCFKIFLNNIHVVEQNILRLEKKPLVLVLPYVGSVSLQTRNKLKKSLKISLLF